MNEANEAFNQIRIKLRQHYVPRDYQTIGGMWTTDTYKHNGVTLHVSSEGYENRIFSESVDAVQIYRNSGEELTFKKGNVEELLKIKHEFKLEGESNERN